jgi:hypothetical protein
VAAVDAGGGIGDDIVSSKIDKAAVMRDAHKRFRDGRRLGLGWTFGQCLSTAWAAAKIRRIWEDQRAAA